MCGITGFYEFHVSRSQVEMQKIGETMSAALTHRGPDAGDVWQDPDVAVILGHRRLSILDVSSDGAQPMESQSGRYVIVYNGEVYNYRDIQNDLGYIAKGGSDTEVILAAIDAWGFDKALAAMNGMFALVVWDRQIRALHFARDRMGKKPLYVGWAGESLVFGSELKALRAHPDFKAEIDRAALSGFLQMGYVEASDCIYDGVWQLPPAHVLRIDLDGLNAKEDLSLRFGAYWNSADVIVKQKGTISQASEGAMVDEFERVLSDCVTDRMVADVSLGAFLSGGIDSSVIVALMQKISKQPIRTYSIGFEDAGYNEAPYAAAVAAHLGTDHHEHICTAQDAMGVIPQLADIYDEPFADISAIPTHLVSRFARGDVTVALSGDGGDEMLGGYSRHIQGPKIWKASRRLPPFLRGAAAWGLEAFARSQAGPRGLRYQKAAGILAVDSQDAAYMRLLEKWDTGHEKALDVPHADMSFAEKMMYWDAVGYLPHGVLTKVDRASMAAGLEARAPLLDMRVFEYVWGLPEDVKIRGGRGKWLLRKVLARHVPEALFERPKQGFTMPVGEWLRGDLRDWAVDLLNDVGHGFFDGLEVERIWDEHLKGHRNHSEKLWVILMFQAWYNRWL